MLPSADKLYGDADFIFNDHGVTVLDWPANSPDLKPRESMRYCQEEDETPDQTMQMTRRPLSKQPGLLLHRSSATG